MIFNAILVISRAQLQIARNTFWRGKLRRKIGLVMLIGLIGLATFGLYTFVGFVIEALRSPEVAAALVEAAAANPGIPTEIERYLTVIPGVALFGALFFLVFSSFSGLLSSLYLSGDIDMLLVAPVPMRSVFIVKFFGGLLLQYAFLFALLGPILLGYGQGMGYGAVYFLSAILVLLLLPLLPAGLGSILVMLVVRVLPARRAREIVSVLGGLIGISFYVLSQLSTEVAPAVAQAENLQTLLLADLPLLPSAWAGRALIAAGTGDPLGLIFYGGLFVTVSVGIFAACVVLAERLYYLGWSNMATQGGRVRERRQPDSSTDAGSSRRGIERLFGFLPQQSQAIAWKDLRLFTRDLRNLQQMIFPLALAGIWTFRLFTEPATPNEIENDLPAWTEQLAGLGSAGIAFFICLSLSSALTANGISREGRAFWVLKLAPISPWRLFLGKLTLAYLPYPTVGSLFILALALISRTAPLVILQQWGILLLTGLGCAAFGMSMGAIFPRLNWENPQQQTTWRAGCLGAFFYPLYLLVVVGVIVGAAAIGSLIGGGPAGAGTVLIGWVTAGLITAGVVWASVALGIRGIERIEV
jgi:ABC-2 type transport system permease protein